MSKLYENQGGLLVELGTTNCAGYIMNFGERGAFGPEKVEIPQGSPTQVEIDAHNEILAKAEREGMIATGRGTFYLTKISKDPCDIGPVWKGAVSQWTGKWTAPWCYVRKGYSYGFCRIKTYWVWFTGPDGKKWYGVNKGNMDCFTARRLKKQD